MYKNIMLPIDLSDPGSWQHSLPVAIELCKKFSCTLHVITVVPDVLMPVGGYYEGYLPADWIDKAIEAARQGVEKFAKDSIPAGIATKLIVKDGVIYDQILAAAKEVGCELILMGSHRPELKDYLLGSNAGRVVRHADCSVMVVRG